MAALILGILGFGLCWVPGLGALLALAALILGIVALVKKAPKRGLAITGVVAGAIGLMAGITVLVETAVKSRLDDARESDARIGACTIKNAVQLYMATHPGKCPTAQDLVDDNIVDPSRGVKDPWDQDYVIDCANRELDVYSPGPDGEPIRCEKGSGEE